MTEAEIEAFGRRLEQLSDDDLSVVLGAAVAITVARFPNQAREMLDTIAVAALAEMQTAA